MCQLLRARGSAENKASSALMELAYGPMRTLARFFFFNFTSIIKISGFQVRAHFICQASKAIVPFNRKWRDAYSPDTHYIYNEDQSYSKCHRVPFERKILFWYNQLSGLIIFLEFFFHSAEIVQVTFL